MKICARQNLIQHAMIPKVLMSVNVILDMNVMHPMMNVRILTNVNKIFMIVRRTLNVPMIMVCGVFSSESAFSTLHMFYLGTYDCTCLPGYFPTESNEHGASNCEDINECDLNASDDVNVCPPDGRCHILDGKSNLIF